MQYKYICHLFLFSNILPIMVVANTWDFFPEIKGKLSAITWAHAVNSKGKLDEALKGPIMMIEADIVIGSLINDTSNRNIPVMAHPPNDTSDISLEQFLSEISTFNILHRKMPKGAKLDFKSTTAFTASLPILKQLYRQVNYPVWINADILPGPINATTVPVDAHTILRETNNFPNFALSIGWTTNLTPKEVVLQGYTEEHISQMVDILKEYDLKEREVTFPLRAALAAISWPQISTLLEVTKASTITVWSSATDNVDVDLLGGIIRVNIGENKTFVDVPSELREKLL